MRIELEEPFKSKWRLAYFQSHKGGRKYIVLFNNNKDRTIIAYARYLMMVKIGGEIPEGYEVDHIDNNSENDDIDNLQLLTSEANKAKYKRYFEENVQESYGFYCSNCGISFILTLREVKMRLKQGVVRANCSKSCATSTAKRKH